MLNEPDSSNPQQNSDKPANHKKKPSEPHSDLQIGENPPENPEPPPNHRSVAGLPHQAFLFPEALRREKNFLKFPFFLLARGTGPEKIEVDVDLNDSNHNKAQIHWKVTGNKEYGSPGFLENKVNNYVERIIGLLPKPITNPIRVGSLSEICRAIGKRASSGSDTNEVKNAFKSIVGATIEAKVSFYLRDKNEYYSEPVFHRYDKALFRGDEMPDGSRADSVFIWLGEPFLESYNSNYTVPIDSRYYDTLPTPLSRRLFELYSLKFYPVFEYGHQHAEIRYSTLCKYVPLSRFRQISRIKQQIHPVHNRYLKSGFLEKVEYEPLKAQADCLIILHPGMRAKNWYWKIKKGRKQLEAPADGDARMVLDRLLEVGISSQVADKLLQEHPLEEIRLQLDLLPFRKSDDPAAVLYKSIIDRWNEPSGYLKVREERKNKTKERELMARQDAIKQEGIKRKEVEIEKLEAFFVKLAPDQKADVDARAHEKLPEFMKQRKKVTDEKGEESPVINRSLEAARLLVLKEMVEAGNQAPEDSSERVQ